MLQEFHFILKKISDRVLRKTAQEVEQTAAAKATASAALAAVPGNLVTHPGAVASPAPSPRMQQPVASSSPGEAGSCTVCRTYRHSDNQEMSTSLQAVCGLEEHASDLQSSHLG